MSETNANPPADGGKQTLSDRVRSLRLSGDKGGTGAGAASRLGMLAWALAAVLSLTTLAFGYRAYRVDKAFRDISASDSGAEVKKKLSAPGYAPGAGDADTRSPGEVVLQSTGYVTPVSLVQVSPKVGGQLKEIPAKFIEGALYKENEIIAEIEDIDYRAEFDQCKATWEMMKQRRQETEKSMPLEIKQAEADIEESRENSTQLKAEVDRNRRLRGTNSVTQKESEQAQAAYTSTMARIRRLEATLELIRDGRQAFRISASKWEEAQAKGAYDKAKWRLDNTRILAPISGMILTKKAEKGNLVNPSAFSSGISASLCDMADLTKLEIDLKVQERDAAKVVKGMPCLIMPEVYNADKTFLKAHPKGYEGTVSRLMPMADRSQGAIPVRVRVLGISADEAGVYMRPDMRVLVSFLKPAEPAK